MLHKDMGKNYESLLQAHDFSHIGCWEICIATDECHLSVEAYRIFGTTPKQFGETCDDFFKLVYHEDIEIIKNMIDNPKCKSIFDMEYRIVRLDGAVRDIHQMVESKFDENGKLKNLYATIQDITEKKDLQNRLGKTQETINRIQKRFQVLVQQSADIFEIISPDATIKYVSPAVEKLVGCKPEERIGKNTLEFLGEKEKQTVTKMIEFVLENPDKTINGDIICRKNEGEEICMILTMSNQIAEPSINGIVINYRDITDRIKSQKEIEYIATHDELTRLPNALYLKKKMANLCNCLSEKEDDTRNIFALIMIDIDGFKYINDALGYQVGDKLIIQVSDRLRAFLGPDVFLCRYSGDQFAIIVERDGTKAEYECILKDIAHEFDKPFMVDVYEFDVTSSMGVSVCSEDETDVDLLINYAKIALLRAKNEGKNRYEFYSSQISAQIYKQLALKNDLMKAIEKNQFRVYYQAQVNLKTSEIIAAEALIRWEHPECGIISPEDFIPIAEETGYIIDLGNWMLTQVCKNYKKWMDEGLKPIKVSVNYSGIQFFETNFVENIENTIAEYGLDPHFLIMEITESVFMKNTEKAILDIKRLKAMGIQVALDDFGTGYSSLSYLNSFNIDILKIDRSFIKNVLLDEASTIITRSVIDLAQELKIKLVAEGIENLEQLSYLKELNCFSGQGYLYNKPVNLEKFEEILSTNVCFPIQDERTEKTGRDKRKFVRIKLPKLVEAEMSMQDNMNDSLEDESMRVSIKNIGAEGMCVATDRKLPVSKDYFLKFGLPYFSNDAKLCGRTVWTHEIGQNAYEYGVEFQHNKSQKTDITFALYSMCKDMYLNN